MSLSTEGQIAGYRIAKPMCDIHTIGAGGGSIAWIDAGGMLKVGPASAGSEPGPVCYERGGRKPTVTDANLLLGYLSKDFFLGGEMKVNEPKTREAMREVIAGPARHVGGRCRGGDLPDHQPEHGRRHEGRLRAAGLRPPGVRPRQRGRRLLDPRLQDRRGGRLHGGHRAASAASVFCALGMLESDIRLDSLKTFHAVVPGVDLAELNACIVETEKKAMAELLQEGVESTRARLVRYLDMRYAGQHHEVTVEIPSGCVIEARHLARDRRRLPHGARATCTRYATPENPLEIMNLRVTAVGAVDKTGLFEKPLGPANAAKALKGTRMAHFEERGGLAEVPGVQPRPARAGEPASPGPRSSRSGSRRSSCTRDGTRGSTGSRTS